MILAILGVLIAAGIACVIMCSRARYDAELGWTIGATISFCLAFVAVIIAVVLTCFVAGASVVDQKIEMYQTENAAIEQQIAETVERYMEYETGIFTEVAPDSATTLVALYPDLKSDELVKAQIEAYISNNNTIKELKCDQLYAPINRWWLYFGK